jgi:diguanylate cyclase (GGDEF)-like protein
MGRPTVPIPPSARVESSCDTTCRLAIPAVAALRVVNGKDLVSPEQWTYVLIALIVAGLALGLLVIVALLARRRDAGPPLEAERLVVAAQPVVRTAAAGPPSTMPASAAAGVHAVGAEPTAADLHADLIDTLEAAPAARSATAGPEATAEGPSETGRRFTVGDRHHEPGAEAAIAGFLSLEPGRVPQEGPVPDPYIDPLTGLDTLLAWERTLAEENARYVRYRRPVSLVVAEIDGLGRLVDRFGAEPARRVLPAVGDAMRRHARRTDRVAHVGGGRFLVLLPETDEVAAINYVERVRVACERWLESGAVALRLAIGWASPTAVGELDTALRTAEERMYAERRRGTRPGAAGNDPIR